MVENKNDNFDYFVKTVYPIDTKGNLIDSLSYDKYLVSNIKEMENSKKNERNTLFQIIKCFSNLEIILLTNNSIIKNKNPSGDRILFLRKTEYNKNFCTDEKENHEYEIMAYKKEIINYKVIYVANEIFKSILEDRLVMKGFWNDGIDCNIKIIINNEEKKYINLINSIFKITDDYEIQDYLINYIKVNKMSDSISLGIIITKLISYFSLNIGLAQSGNVFNWIEPASNFIPEKNSINKYINKKDKEWIIFDNKGEISINNFEYNHTGEFKKVEML